MKTISLQEATERATKGPPEIKKNVELEFFELRNSDGKQVGLITQAGGLDSTAALIRHRWNTYQELVEALKGVVIYAEAEAESLSGAEHKDGESCGANEAWEAVEAAQTALSKAENVEVGE